MIIDWISDRLWQVSDWFISAATACRKASIGILVYRLQRKRAEQISGDE